jgi:hypothetical protein
MKGARGAKIMYYFTIERESVGLETDSLVRGLQGIDGKLAEQAGVDAGSAGQAPVRGWS